MLITSNNSRASNARHTLLQDLDFDHGATTAASQSVLQHAVLTPKGHTPSGL
jgi:hypothetical protein